MESKNKKYVPGVEACKDIHEYYNGFGITKNLVNDCDAWYFKTESLYNKEQRSLNKKILIDGVKLSGVNKLGNKNSRYGRDGDI